MSLSGINGMIELVGGVLIVLGLFTRPVAFILAGDMAVAYFIAHAPRGFFPLLNAGELAIIYCFVFLYFAVAGGGVWSLDHLRAGDKASRVGWRTWGQPPSQRVIGQNENPGRFCEVTRTAGSRGMKGHHLRNT